MSELETHGDPHWDGLPPASGVRGFLLDTPTPFTTWQIGDTVHIPVKPGLTVLAGVNGSGKTYLLEALARILSGRMGAQEGVLVDVPDVLIAFAQGDDWWEPRRTLWPGESTGPRGSHWSAYGSPVFSGPSTLRKSTEEQPFDEFYSNWEHWSEESGVRLGYDPRREVRLEGLEREILQEVLRNGMLLVTRAYAPPDPHEPARGHLVGVPVLPPWADAPLTRAAIASLVDESIKADSDYSRAAHILVNARNPSLERELKHWGEDWWAHLPPMLSFGPLRDGFRLFDYVWDGSDRQPYTDEWAFHLALALSNTELGMEQAIGATELRASDSLRAAVGGGFDLRLRPWTLAEAVWRPFSWFPRRPPAQGGPDPAERWREGRLNSLTRPDIGDLYGVPGVDVPRDPGAAPPRQVPGLEGLSRVEQRWARLCIEAACKSMTTLPKFVLIDEAESGLHRSAERSAAAHLAGPRPLGLEGDPFVIVTSHSPDFINQKSAEVTKVVRGRPQPFTRSFGSLVSSFGLRPADVLASRRAVLLVEGEHDHVIVRSWFGDPTRARGDLLERHGIEVMPIFGVKNADQKAVFDIWEQYSEAPICVLMDNTDNSWIQGLWAEVAAKASAGAVDAARSLLRKRLAGSASGEARAWLQILEKALKRSVEHRVFTFGLAEGDIIEYLAADRFGVKTWDRRGYDAYAASRRQARRWPDDFKTWQRGRGARINTDLVRTAASSVSDGDPAQSDLEQVMHRVIEIAGQYRPPGST